MNGLSLKKMYSLYSLWMFPHRLSVASEAQLRTRKGCMQLITSHDKKDHDGKTNEVTSRFLPGAMNAAATRLNHVFLGIQSNHCMNI